MIQPLMIGTTELIVIGGAVLLLFGGKKIPELMRSLGQGVKNFKEGMHEKSDIRGASGDVEKDALPYCLGYSRVHDIDFFF